MWYSLKHKYPKPGEMIMLCYQDRTAPVPRVITALFRDIKQQASGDKLLLRLDGSSELRSIAASRVHGWAPLKDIEVEAYAKCCVVSGTKKYKQKRKTEGRSAYKVDTQLAQSLIPALCVVPVRYKVMTDLHIYINCDK